MRSTTQYSVIALVSILAVCSSVSAADRFWIDPFGGSFDDVDNWDDEVVGIPGLDDIAIFDLSAIYDVLFAGAFSNQRVVVRRGHASFNFEGDTYTLTMLNPLTPSITVGDSDGDLAELSISGGALHGMFADIGRAAPSIGMLNVTGANSSLSNDFQLRVGNEGNGFLTVSDGATVSNGAGHIATLGGTIGSAEIIGKNSTWTNEGSLTVGRLGLGEIIIGDGAVVSCLDAIIAQQVGSIGNVIVTGGGQWLIDGTLDVGMSGFGSLTISDGGFVSNHTFATVGTFPIVDDSTPYNTSAVGDVIVTGHGSLWSINGDLHVPLMAFVGTLTLDRGGRVEVAGDLHLNEVIIADAGLHVGLGSSDDYAAEPAIHVDGTVSGEPSFIELNDNFTPEAGDVFHIAHSDFGVIDLVPSLPELPPPLFWIVSNNGSDLIIRVGPIEGDINNDGVVGPADLAELLAQWGACDKGDPGACTADIAPPPDGDGVVGPADLAALLAAWS